MGDRRARSLISFPLLALPSSTSVVRRTSGAGPRPKPRNCPTIHKVPDMLFKTLNAEASGLVPVELD